MSAPLRIRPPATKAVGGDAEGLKSYLDRLLKLIPAEVLSLFVVGNGLIPADALGMKIGWALFCLLATGLVKAYGTSDSVHRVPPDWVHVALSMVAFVLWVYAGGGLFVQLGWHNAPLGSLFILAFTFLVPYVYRGQKER